MKHARTWEKFVIGFTLCTAALLADLQGSASARQGSEANQGKRVLKIRIEVEGTAVLATLNGSPSARDFVSLLPLTMTLEDYGGIEKIAYLPRKLSTRDAPAGVRPTTLHGAISRSSTATSKIPRAWSGWAASARASRPCGVLVRSRPRSAWWKTESQWTTKASNVSPGARFTAQFSLGREPDKSRQQGMHRGPVHLSQCLQAITSHPFIIHHQGNHA
jgi:hypothetical protein